MVKAVKAVEVVRVVKAVGTVEAIEVVEVERSKVVKEKVVKRHNRQIPCLRML